jgi:polyhydroxyalkanoate synthesis regulator phasin
MNPIQFIQSITKNSSLQGVNGAVIKPGQILHGRIEKLYPNNIALVQLGNLKLHAQIEVGLEAVNRYLFEVQMGEQGEVKLKVIDHKSSAFTQGTDSLASLLKQFHLAESNQNLKLLQFFTTKDIPFTKEQFIKSSQWLKDTNNESKALTALEMMVKKDLPFTNQIFQSMVAVQSTQSLASELSQLSNWLKDTELPNSEALNQLKGYVSTMMGEVSAEQAKKVIQELIKLSLQPATREAALGLLNKLEVGQLNLSQAMLQLNETIKRDGSKLTELNGITPTTREVTQKNINDFSNQVNKIPQMIQDLLTTRGSLTKVEGDLLKQVSNQVFPQRVNLDNGQEVMGMLKRIISSLGLGYEKELENWTKAEENLNQKFEGLKPLLLAAMHELGVNGRELDSFANRLTGLQLLSQESSGPIQQIFMQIPLALGNKQSDLTLQWTGRKTEDGQIDPGYCRVLFYLDLENINETVIDMQVQNRIISITVINDTEGLDYIVSRIGHQLKQQLSTMNYHLSNVKVVSSLSKTPPIKTFSPSQLSHDQYRGVDLKI